MQVSLGKWKIDGSLMAAAGAVVVLLIVLVVVSPGRGDAEQAPVSESIDIPDPVTVDAAPGKLEAYGNADRRDVKMTDSADSLWTSLRTEDLQAPREDGTSLSRVFGITDDMLSEHAETRTHERETPSAPARRPSARKPEPVTESVPVDMVEKEPDPPVTVPTVPPYPQSGLVSSVGASQERRPEDLPERLIRCMFIRDERVRSGQRVQVRLLEDLTVDGYTIPANSHLTALCSLGDRLQLEISSLQVNGMIIRAGFRAYDSDGVEGLYCPDTQTSMERASRGSTGTVISAGGSALSQTLSGLLGYGVSAGTNAAAQAASSQTASVQVSAGYRFYLLKRNDNR